jgi:hypothetical protein
MTIAHVGGIPLEEWILPMAATAGGLAFALRAVFRR